MTTIPYVKSSKDDTGLTSLRGIVYIVYKVDGQVRKKSLRTEDWKEARKLRDQEFKRMLAAGAKVVKPRTPKEKVQAEPLGGLYIYRRTPYYVQIGGKLIGEVETFKEATAMRNKHLGIK